MKKGISPKELLKQQRALLDNDKESTDDLVLMDKDLQTQNQPNHEDEVNPPISLSKSEEDNQKLSKHKSKSIQQNRMTDAEVKGLFNQAALELSYDNLNEFSDRILGKSMSSRSMFLTDEFISTIKRYKDITGEKRSINEFINIFCYYGMSRLYDELKKSKEFKEWINMVK
jgi:hypothetical protein